MNKDATHLTRANLLAFFGTAAVLAGCSSAGIPIASNKDDSPLNYSALEKLGIRVSRTRRFPSARPDGTFPPLKLQTRKPEITATPCPGISDCSGPGGGGLPPSYTIDYGGFDQYCYGTSSYGEAYDLNGDLVSQSYFTANSDGSTSYRFVGSQNTVTGTEPYPASVPNDSDSSYLGWTLHLNTTTGIVSVTDPSTGNVIYAQIDSSNNIVISSANQPTSTNSLQRLGYSSDLSHSCMEGILKAVALGLISAGVAAAIIGGLCTLTGGWGCAFGWLLGGEVVHLGSSAAIKIAKEYGC